MNRSDLIERLWARSGLPRRVVELAVTAIIAHMIDTLALGERIELRGFGSFLLRYRATQARRNPKTGAPITVPGKYIVFFRVGKPLRERVNRGHLENCAVAVKRKR